MELPGEPCEGGRRVSLAAGYDRVLEGMEEIRRHTGGAVRGFHEMSPEDIARETGLPVELAALAKQREFDEPFQLLRNEPGWPAELESIAGRRGLRLSRGGRFRHLHGETDKGRAVGLVTSLYHRGWGGVRTIGAGDSEMDGPLLAAVDVPIVVAKPDGSIDPVLSGRFPRALASAPGPAGWGRAVLEALRSTLDDTFFMAGNHSKDGV